ncbi:predicted protein [Sclerotinia sclerotiorum 1980 UF-70]|uniref:Uncharacterized protein n=1 Tax=Sclerotinia sclerotiorum (strain ATCC 18683 / 1980 / Ss-1) TaxID=665079 RepID=A7EV56_SCLS1|nr:predicted protein [Sclerotinia sclerotiorum 1980 UF-70]EDN93348.1 predicted protein [Sclerotinia sclerotiorum 1980 UF-70]
MFSTETKQNKCSLSRHAKVPKARDHKKKKEKKKENTILLRKRLVVMRVAHRRFNAGK